eukprot:1156850-Pelagomonas_calceolata.AAC.11
MAARCGEVWTHVVTGASRKPQVLMNVCCGLRGFAGGWLHRYWPSRQTARRVWLIVAPADAGCGALLGRGCRGLAGFDGEELREVSAQPRPPQRITVPAGFAGFSPQPPPVQLQHQPGSLAVQPGLGGVGSYGGGSAGSLSMQQAGATTMQSGLGGVRFYGQPGINEQQGGMSGVGSYGSGSAGGTGGVGGVSYGVGSASAGPSGLPQGVTSQGVSLFDQENLHARQLMEEQAYAQQRLQQQQQRGMVGGVGRPGSAGQLPRGVHGAGLQGSTGPTSLQPAVGMSAQPTGLTPYSNMGLGREYSGGVTTEALAAAPSQQQSMPLQQQSLHHRGLQQQPLPAAFAGQGGRGGVGGFSGLSTTPAVIPRVPSNRFGQGASGAGLLEPQLSGAPGSVFGLGYVPQQQPQPATPSAAQEYGLSSEMSSPDPSATPGGGCQVLKGKGWGGLCSCRHLKRALSGTSSGCECHVVHVGRMLWGFGGL